MNCCGSIVCICWRVVRRRDCDGFVGALPPEQIREFLDKHVPAGAAPAAIDDVPAAAPSVEDITGKLLAQLQVEHLDFLLGKWAEESQAVASAPIARLKGLKPR